MRAYRTLSILTVAFAAVLSLWTPRPCAAQQFTPVDLGVLQDGQGQTIRPLQMNAGGQILGAVMATSELVLWQGGAITDVGLNNFMRASMNNKGEVVGWAYDSVGGYRGFIYLPADAYGRTAGLTTGSLELYYAVNDSGLVASVDSVNNLYLKDLNGSSYYLYGFTLGAHLNEVIINASGAVAGYYTDNATGATQAFYGSFDAGSGAGGLSLLSGLDGSNSVVNDLNDLGAMAGYSVPSGSNEASAWAVTVSPAPLAVSSATSARKGGTLTESVALRNDGTSAANNVVVDAVLLMALDSFGDPAGDPVISYSTPVSLKPIDAGATRTFSVKFTAASVLPGAYMIGVQGTCSLGAFQITTGPITVR